MLLATLRSLFVGATIALAASLEDVDGLVRETTTDLLVTDISAADGDAMDRNPSWVVANRGTKRTLVATSHIKAAVVHSLLRSDVAGVFDTGAEGGDKFNQACATIVEGGSYWSASVREAIIHAHVSPLSVVRLLTPTEQMVLGVIGDGCDDNTAAATLPLSASRIRKVRESLHRKFGIQYKGDLVERAFEHGFIVRTEERLIRPGLAHLIAAHRSPTPIVPRSALRYVA